MVYVSTSGHVTSVRASLIPKSSPRCRAFLGLVVESCDLMRRGKSLGASLSVVPSGRNRMP
eukprot:4128611-Pyramimonas_sp.AAC.1